MRLSNLSLSINRIFGGFGQGASLALDFTSGNNTLDPRITFTRSTTASYFNSSGVLSSAAINAPRFDYDPVTLAARGLLIEEQRTNTIRNSTMQGAVAGTPGTLPTNWSQSNNTGLAANVVGTGTENGINYIDLRINGTSTGTGQTNVFLDTATGIAALTAQVWSFSPYLKVQAGSLANITSINLVLQENTSGGVAVTAGSQAVSVPTTALSSYRPTYTRTLSGGGTVAALRPYIQFNINTGLAVDITLRIGLPQLEQGAFATSAIPTTSAQVTRTADIAVMTGTNFSSWFNATEGTVYADAQSPQASGYIWTLMRTGTGFGPRLQMTFSSVNVSYGAVVDDSSTLVVSLTATGSRSAFAYKTDDYALSANGGSIASDTSGSLPTAIAQMRLGNNPNSGVLLNGWLRRIAYYPRRLSNAELQGITS